MTKSRADDVTRATAAARLAQGASFRAVARECGVSDSTIRRWLSEDPEFAAQVLEGREKLLPLLDRLSTSWWAQSEDCFGQLRPMDRIRAAGLVSRSLAQLRAAEARYPVPDDGEGDPMGDEELARRIAELPPEVLDRALEIRRSMAGGAVEGSPARVN